MHRISGMYEAPRDTNDKPPAPLYEQLVALPGWDRIALLFVIVAVATALFCIWLGRIFSETPL